MLNFFNDIRDIRLFRVGYAAIKKNYHNKLKVS